MTLDISGKRFEDYRNWVDKKRAKGWSWEKIFLAGKSSEEGLAAFIENQVEDNDWEHISVDDWYAFIDQYKDILDNIGCASKGPFVSENNDRKVPENYNSAWQRYKDNLINEKHFSMASVANIEKSALRTLNSLRDDNGGANAVKGLVVGNVQSGKTANMGALISMAADYGWNMFIILTGTIENLRVQNQKRFIKDLVNGNLTWVSLLHPGSKDTLGFSQLDLRESSNARYVTCCLKNSKRLEHLFKWLNSDKNKKKQLKVLLIDDEADQAGLNTKDVHADEIERTKINGYLCDIVNNTDKGKKKDTPYAAMDYVAYTATPYGNFLNEATEESLYPRDFIDTLCPSDFYFGPQQIFGDVVRYKWEGMPIINNIPGENKIGRNAASDDIAKLDAICNGDIDPKSGDIPDSLKQAIAWFSVAVAIRREQKSKDPVSMLMHHTMRIGKHTNIGFAVRYWFKHIDQDDFIDLCRSVYDEQTVQFSKDIFKETCSAYGELSGFDLDDINDYPSFADLKKHLYDLYENVRHVCFDDTDESYVFHKGTFLYSLQRTW